METTKLNRLLLQLGAIHNLTPQHLSEGDWLTGLLRITVSALDASGGILYLQQDNRTVQYGEIPANLSPDSYVPWIQERPEPGNFFDTDSDYHLVTPLWWGDLCFGALAVVNRQSGGGIMAFDTDDRSLLSAMAALIGGAIDHRLLREQQDRHEQNERDEIAALIIGDSEAIANVHREIARVTNSGTKVAVLLHGESGTGKELVAEAIHKFGPRRNKPFITLNCSSLSETLLESMLCGHERGAFTSADKRTDGHIAAADGGVLFLDEIGDLPLNLQPRLLRILDNKPYTRVGGTEELQANFQLVCATHVNLEEAVANKAFRQDLFYRISQFPIRIPPLRDRGEDILRLARHFLYLELAESKKAIRGFTKATITVLEQYEWPGNIRELRSVISNSIIRCDETLIDSTHLDTRFSPERQVVGESSGQLLFDEVIPLEDAIAKYVQFAYTKLGQRTRATMQKLGGISYRRMMRYLEAVPEHQLVIPMQKDIELKVTHQVLSAMEKKHWPVEKQIAMSQSITEAILNAIEHSHSKRREIEVGYTITSSRSQVVIRDFGEGFDKDLITDVNADEKINSRISRGWGLHIIKESTDSLEINTGAGGTTLILNLNR